MSFYILTMAVVRSVLITPEKKPGKIVALSKKSFFLFFFVFQNKDFFVLGGKIFSFFLSSPLGSCCQKAHSHNSGMTFSNKIRLNRKKKVRKTHRALKKKFFYFFFRFCKQRLFFLARKIIFIFF